MKMKRIVLPIAIVLTLGLSVNAQSDGFFSTSYQEYGREEYSKVLPALPKYGTEYDQVAPLGSGLLLLAGMGAAYALRKKRK